MILSRISGNWLLANRLLPSRFQPDFLHQISGRVEVEPIRFDQFPKGFVVFDWPGYPVNGANPVPARSDPKDPEAKKNNMINK